MAVIVKYVVERNGEEKMTFTSKAEADAYDKMLDMADELFELLGKSALIEDVATKSWRCSWLKTKKTYCAHWEPSVNLFQQRARSRKRLQTVMTMSLSTTLLNQENR